MKILLLLISVFFICQIEIFSQNPKASNDAMKFLNEAVLYVNPMMRCLKQYHEDVERYKKAKNKENYGSQMRHYSAYQCSKQLEDYYYNEALKNNSLILNPKIQELWQALEKLDKQCKEVEIYIRLEDYKKDNMQKSDRLLADFPQLFKDFNTKKEALHEQVNQLHFGKAASSPFGIAEKQMLDILAVEAKLLKSWNYNFNEEIHTGFPVELIAANIQANEELLRKIQKSNLPYPANSAYDSFMAGLRDMQEIKRKTIDDYNFEAKKSDKHANEVYLDLINYYNGVLAAFQNTFVDFSKQNGQSPVYQAKFSPLFELKSAEKNVSVSVKAFKDIPLIAFEIAKQNVPISKNTHQALNNYLDFINEALHQNQWLMYPLRNFNSDANYRKENNKRNLNYKAENYKTPKSAYQKTLDESKFLPETARKSVNTQLEVLMNILTEMEELSAELEIYTQNETYENDNLKRSDEILQRYVVLYEIFDAKKEQLYLDTKRVFDAYKIENPANSWVVSGKALLQTVDVQRDILFTAKNYFKGDSTSIPSDEKLENLHENIRSLIAKEYDNMKGIERIGRNNGLCPYNPYEYIPDYAKTFLEKVEKLPTKPIQQQNYGQRHPYEEYVYQYNIAIEQYIKFGELAKIPILKHIKQPELFILRKFQKQPIKTNTEIKKSDEPGEDKDFLKTMEGYALNNLVFLLDVSASMAPAEKLPLLKKSIKFLIRIMRPQDEISVVVYSGNAEVILQGVSSQDTEKINAAIDKLRSDGRTNSEDGIRLAYKTASKNFIKSGNNRIIMATDGEFETSEKVYQLVEKNVAEGISLSIFSFGKDEKKYENLIKLADKGKGNYEHINEENANYKLVKEAKAKKAE